MRFYFEILIASVLLTGCDNLFLGKEEKIISLEENLQIPEPLNDGWETSDLPAQQIKQGPIHGLVENLQSNAHNIHSFLIVRNNKLVLEAYFSGWHRERLHALRSASKTFVSTLVGIAIDQGRLINTDLKVFDYFPEYGNLNTGFKKNIELKHVLTMTSGLQWDETTYPSDDKRNDESEFDQSEKRLQYLFNKPMSGVPGTSFVYNSALPVLQSALIQKATGFPLEQFAGQFLFEPLGITNYYWRKNPEDGLINAIGPLFLGSRDMAKLGQLFLDKGKWKGRQIISSNWVEAATTTYIGDETRQTGYGYNWWTARYRIGNSIVRTYFAQGSGGQYIFVVPDYHAVIVFTGGNYPPLDQGAPLGMLVNIILPAMN